MPDYDEMSQFCWCHEGKWLHRNGLYHSEWHIIQKEWNHDEINVLVAVSDKDLKICKHVNEKEKPIPEINFWADIT